MSEKSRKGLLFVECNGSTGRPSRVVRPLLSRHVMGKRVATNSYHSGEIIFEDEDPPKNPTSNRPARRRPTAHQRSKSSKIPRDDHSDIEQHLSTDRVLVHQRRPTEASLPHIQILNSSCHQLVEETAQWWFYCGDEISQPFQIAQYHWATAAWDISRQSQFFLECIKLYAWRKRSQLTGNADRYYAQQLSLIRRIKDNINEHGENLESEPLALVGIGILAYVALLDADLETSATHLHALRAFDLPRHFENSKQGWLYMVWVDLRFSLIQASPPVLDYFVPSAFRETLPTLSSEEETKMQQIACRNTASVPCSTLFDEVEMHCVLLKLRCLYNAWSPSQESQLPFYGLLYDIEYRLRVTHARLRQCVPKDANITDDEKIGLNTCVELILLSIQLHVWIVSRHWAPVSSYSRQTVLCRAYDLICQVSAPNLVNIWQRVGDIRSLVWCLTTFTAFSLEMGVDKLEMVKTLQYTLASSGLFAREDLSELLQEWFWLDNWHVNKLELVWKVVEESDVQKLCAGFERPQKQQSCFYVGAVEFYNPP